MHRGNASFKNYILGLKGLACLLVMSGHYVAIYKFAQSFSPPLPVLNGILRSPAKFSVNASYWLALFFVISGYLLANSRIENFRDFLRKSICRFFRLGLPVLFSYAVIYLLMYKGIGFHNYETGEIFACDWFQTHFFRGAYTFTDVVKSPIDVLILGKTVLNRPFWVLKMMFVASLLIYLLKLLQPKNDTFEVLFWIAAVFLSIMISPIVSSCLMGTLTAVAERKFEENHRDQTVYLSLFILSLSLCALSSDLLWAASFSIILFCIPRIHILDRFFSSPPLQFIGRISWGIYSYHWPLIASLGAVLLISLSKHFGLANAYRVSFFIILLLTLLLSIVNYYTLEKLASSIVRYLNKKLAVILK